MDKTDIAGIWMTIGSVLILVGFHYNFLIGIGIVAVLLLMLWEHNEVVE